MKQLKKCPYFYIYNPKKIKKIIKNKLKNKIN